jgi:hypothetical protein
MQSYSNPESRNTMRAAGNPMKTGAAIGGGGNQTQGAGQIPGKVSVPMPGTNTTQPEYKSQAGKMKAPMGFNNGLITGKI